MTIISVCITEKNELALVADRIIDPFDWPRLAVKPKIFEGPDFVFGVSGTVQNSGVNALLTTPFAELKDLILPATDTHVILIHEGRVYLNKCNSIGMGFIDCSAFGELPTIGCFAPILSASIYGRIPRVQDALDRIRLLHAAYGFECEGDCSASLFGQAVTAQTH